MAFRRARGRAVRAKRETYWSTTLISQDSIDSGAVTSLNLVDRDDWSAGATSFERGGRLERIRGNFCLNNSGVTTTAGAIFMAIWLVNDDEAAPDPTSAADYLENDCLWTHVVNGVTILLTSAGVWSPSSMNVPIDVKVRRNLTSQSIVLLTYRAVGGSSDENFVMSGVIRSLTSAP